MQRIKRFLSIALALVLVLSCIPASVLATDSVTPSDSVSSTEKESTDVAKNTATGKVYTTVSAALLDCAAGQTVVLMKDVTEQMVAVFADATLDLNGYTLTAGYVSSFGDIVDNSTANSGVLVVDANRLMIREDNAQMSVHNGTGYQFVEVLRIDTRMINPSKFAFQPRFEPGMLELLKKGSDVTGITIQVQVSWTDTVNKGKRTQLFEYNDSLLLDYLGSYKPDTDKYGKMFTLTLNGAENVEGLTFVAMAVSNTKITASSNDPKPQKPAGNVTTDANNQVVNDVTIGSGNASALVPSGTQLENGANNVTLNATEMEETTSNITVGDGEKLVSMDVHVDGVAANNTKPIIVTLTNLAPEFLNQGNLSLYHVENGETVEMTRVYALADVDAHNEYYYDIATGTITMALATFSEVAVVSDVDNAWNGNVAESFNSGTGTKDDPYIIANADQLAAFGAIVGGMLGNDPEPFTGKYIKLMADINLGDKETENNPDIIFYPIGYYNSDGTYERTSTAITSGLRNFEGTFDGNGHTVSNFYQNTWEMKGDNNYYDATLQYYRDGMGLFGRVYGGTVKNLTVANFSSDGEYTTTGVIAAYADGATFENISIFNCNPRVYNIGNGGIVGCVGWYAKEKNLKTTFKNITVDNSNKISALWGSWDVACGGIVGQYYPTSGQSSANYPVNAGIHFENCHISAQMDVYNDVCANYQYYAYRYTGMLIGSVRENVTVDGHSYPKMDGISAKDCTVHFGTWNDYYYCEIIDNTTASYTHDYQMSRLTEIKAIDGTTITYLDGTTGTVPATGRANYVIVDYTKGHGTENATCYHFKDGAVWTHDMGGIQTGIDENGDGQDDLKEDKQHIYLEFNNLVTGYGWGVTSKGVGDLAGVTILDREVGNSVEKFESTVTELANNKTYKLSDIFTFVNTGVELVPSALAVAITNLDENNPVSATIVYDSKNWENGTITLTGTGKVNITIQDYYFCTPTTITVNVTARQSVAKFDKLFNKDFLYRVGNQNTVTLGSLFKAADDATIGTVAVTIEAVNGTPVSGTYTSNATWPNGTIKFSGTGVVKVTITDNDYCTPTTLYLEVVDAENVTEASKANAKDKNVVLLNDITPGSLTVSSGYALYGNGFTINFNGDGSYSSAALSYGFVTLDGGTLDNVQIKCKIFPKSYLYTNEMRADNSGRYPYGYSAVVASNGSVISNCYIYGARNNIHATSGNLTVSNTVLECGSVANIHCTGTSSDLITLHNVTTIQYKVTDDFGQNANVLGFGILVGTNESANNASIKLTGEFKQYNWVTSDDTSVSNAYAQTAIREALSVSSYQHSINGKTTVNMGIAILNSLNCTITDDERTNKQITYEKQNISMSGYNGQVCSIVNGNNINAAPSYYDRSEVKYAPKYNAIAPSISHNSTNASVSMTTKYENSAWQNILSIDLDKISVGSYNFNFKDLIVNKYGAALSFTIKDANGKVVDSNTSLTLNQLFTGEYTLEIVDTQIYNSKGELTGDVVTHTIPFVVKATKTSIDPPVFTNKGTAQAVMLQDDSKDWSYAFPVLDGITVRYWSSAAQDYKTVELSTIEVANGSIDGNVWTYTCDDFTLTITGGKVHSDNSKITPKVSSDGKTLYFASLNKMFGTSTTQRDLILDYVFSDTNASTSHAVRGTVKYSSSGMYDYEDFEEDGSLATPDNDSCVTGDTLVTLADGSTKRINEVVLGDLLLVWNFYEGKYDIAPAAVIFDHGITYNKVISLTFSNGTIVKVVKMHQFFDADLNQFVTINAENVADYVGHKFVSLEGNVELVSYSITEEHVDTWGVMTALHYNIIVEGMLSSDFDLQEVNLFHCLKVGENMKFDEAQLQADIEMYGLYTYEDFAEYATYEQFVAFNAQYFKIPVGKGLYTFEGILALIAKYL